MKFKEYCKNIELVTCDMWEGFTTLIHRYCKNADIVYDKFHIIRHLNHSLNEVRKNIIKDKSIFEDKKKELKGKKYLILSNKNNLTKEKKSDLVNILKISNDLKVAYELKEEFIKLFNEKLTLSKAEIKLNDWKLKALSSNLKPYIKFVKMLDNWHHGVINYFKYYVTNALAEGINNKIKTVKKIAYGYRNPNNFKAKILQSMALGKNI